MFGMLFLVTTLPHCFQLTANSSELKVARLPSES
uniref:Uncharacterized protein n=1 Tax=Anguilla anguilla TaxID=7936 RepID=A0A0E9TPL0_ANGAN